MELENVIEHLCRLPIDFYGGSKSILQLINASGFAQNPSVLSASSISRYLAHHPEIIEAWILWSDNKRASSGWYFKRQADGYIVGSHPNGEVFSFADPISACSEFIVREIPSIASPPRPE
jgi:hypothetical protein